MPASVDYALDFMLEESLPEDFLEPEPPYFGTELANPGTSDDALDTLNLAFRSVLHLLKTGQKDLLLLIDDTGACASGEATPLYAALCLLRYQRGQEYSKHASHDELEALLEQYAGGSISLANAAAIAHMDKRKFKALAQGRGLTIRSRGRKPKSSYLAA